MDIWTANPASGFTLGRDNKSVERTKKFPWNVWMERPAEDQSGEKSGHCHAHLTKGLTWAELLDHRTFAAAYSHDSLKADLSG